MQNDWCLSRVAWLNDRVVMGAHEPPGPARMVYLLITIDREELVPELMTVRLFARYKLVVC